MKRTPLPPRENPLARVRLKRPRIARFQAAGEAEGCVLVVRAEKSHERAVGPKKRPKKPVLRFGGIPQNPDYLEFVRSFQCILFGLQPIQGIGSHACSGKTEAAHTGPHGRGQKAADETALPLCSNGHRTGKYAHHKLGKNFWAFWGIDQAKLIQSFNEMARESEVLVQGFK